MSNQTKSEEPNAVSDGVVDEWRPRKELAAAMLHAGDSLCISDSEAIVSESEISFRSIVGRTTIAASPVGVVTIDGLTVADRIDIRSELPVLFDELTDEQLAAGNRFATTGAMVREPDTGKVVVASALPLYAEDGKALETLYAAIIGSVAFAQAHGAFAGVCKMLGVANDSPGELKIWGWDRASRWDKEEFEYAISMMKGAGVFCNASETNLTAEFRWDPGAVSWVTGGRTSLLTVYNDNPHPTAGNGLFYRLNLPLHFSWEELVSLANLLNAYDIAATDVPPSFGAWCGHVDNCTLSYVGFWPNFMYYPGTVANLSAWCRIRSDIARQVIGNKLMSH